MQEYLRFSSRGEFRSWLEKNCCSGAGVWLLFVKSGGEKTIKAGEALEEALCFGWIDGKMKKIDGESYIKYFISRRKNSKWSDKNKALVKRLEEQGFMTDYGRAKIEEARKNGQWGALVTDMIADEQIQVLANLLKEHKTAYINFQAMSPSVKKTYTKAYYDAKTDAGRSKRFLWMIERLNKNLKPM